MKATLFEAEIAFQQKKKLSMKINFLQCFSQASIDDYFRYGVYLKVRRDSAERKLPLLVNYQSEIFINNSEVADVERI